MRLPTRDTIRLATWARQVIDDCRSSQGQRAAAYRQYGQWIETGRASGGLALANLIYSHNDRVASHLFSPSELRCAVDYESKVPAEWLLKGEVAARVVSREWERKNTDILFGHGVKEALNYGACLMKQLAARSSDGGVQYRGARLVMPWAMGVYDEGVNDLSEQEAFVETVWMTKHEVWRRVRNLPEAERLYKRILGNAKHEDGSGVPTSFMHQVLSTAVLNTNLQNMTQPTPGGIVQLTNDPNFATLGPQVSAEMFPMHELWVKDDNRPGEDYTTIQFFEPDIIVAPLFKHTNLFAPEEHPYTLIQPNFVAGYFWGRSEIVDLMMLQAWLTEHLDDAKRLMGQQIDKILAFIGMDGITDEQYATFRSSGYMGMPPNTDVKDLTPKLPEQMIPLIGEIIQMMNLVSGFPPVMTGQGDPGVRSGNHADTLMKTGSPRLRDRSLLVERQCNDALDTTLSLLQAKDARQYEIDPAHEETGFLLAQLPDDRRITVDSHSGSPIYVDDQLQLLSYSLKNGVITGESFIEQSPLKHKDILIQRLKAKEAEQMKIMLEHPELLSGTSSKARRAGISQAAEGGGLSNGLGDVAKH